MFKKLLIISFLAITATEAMQNQWNRGNRIGNFQQTVNHPLVRCGQCGASFPSNQAHTCPTCSRCGLVHKEGSCQKK